MLERPPAIPGGAASSAAGAPGGSAALAAAAAGQGGSIVLRTRIGGAGSGGGGTAEVVFVNSAGNDSAGQEVYLSPEPGCIIFDVTFILTGWVDFFSHLLFCSMCRPPGTLEALMASVGGAAPRPEDDNIFNMGGESGLGPSGSDILGLLRGPPDSFPSIFAPTSQGGLGYRGGGSAGGPPPPGGSGIPAPPHFGRGGGLRSLMHQGGAPWAMELGEGNPGVDDDVMRYRRGMTGLTRPGGGYEASPGGRTGIAGMDDVAFDARELSTLIPQLHHPNIPH